MNPQLSLASALAAALLHSLWQLALIGLLAALHLAAMRGSRAGARHLVGMVWLVAMALAPIVTFVACWQLPSWAATPGLVWTVASIEPPELTGRAAFSPTPWHGWALVCLSQAWLAGVVLMVSRQVGGWRLVQRIERQPFIALPPAWQQRVAAIGAGLGISRRVCVRLSAQVASPFTAHLMRPLIWLPLSLLTGLPVAQVEALLAHELAHIRRFDWCWNALQCAIEAVLFHHPAMWWLSRRIREEREHACDDLAVAVCPDAVALAEALAALSRCRERGTVSSYPCHFSTLALKAEGGSLMKRITRLLAPAPSRPNWRVPGALLLLFGCGTLLAMQVSPPAHLLTNLTTDASSGGTLTPGNHREFGARYLGDKTRRYRIEMDASGAISERYTEGDEAKPIDEGVRRWLAAMTEMSASGTLPNVLAKSQAPVAAPRTASPPALADETSVLIDAIRSDDRVTAVIGTPVRFDRSSLHGRVHTWGSRDFHIWGVDDPVAGTASFSATFEGPNGRVNVAYAGKTTSRGAWRAETFAVSPLPH